MIALLLAALTAQFPDFPDIVGQCDIIATLDEARTLTNMPSVAHLPGLDAQCREAFEALGQTWPDAPK